MELFIGIVFTIYCLLLILLSVAWRKNRVVPTSKALMQELSVIIPVRNEARNIGDLLRDIRDQDHTAGHEVIVVDDDSEDDTAEIVEEFVKSETMPLKLIRLSSNGYASITPKKRALKTGIEQAKGDIIVTIDGDCRAPKTWLSAIDQIFKDEAVHFVSGPVTYMPSNSVFDNLQTLEFASLIGVGASSIQLGYPNICNGANLAFRKESFKKINGYNGNGHIASGDDEFLLQKFATLFPEGIRFAKDRCAVVTTSAKSSIKDFYHQRKRWTSKLKHHKEWHIKLLSGGAWIVNFTLIVAIILAGFSLIDWRFLMGVWILKGMFEAIYIREVMSFFQKKMKWFEFILLELIHPFYIVLLGLFTNFGTFNWKGRTYYE